MGKLALVIDDSTLARRLIGDTLAQAGFEVVEGTDGIDGLAKVAAAKAPFALITTDIHMPRMNGLEFLRSLRTRPEYKSTPVLILSAEVEKTLRDQARAAGATGWWIKPFNREKMLELVRRMTL